MYFSRQGAMTKLVPRSMVGETMRKKAGQYLVHCLDAIIERICCISGLCLLIGLALGFIFLSK
jgi:hypothetical protein